MRMLMSGALGGGELAFLAFGEASADHLTNIFFGMCRAQLRLDGVELDKDEQKVARELKKAVKATIHERNDFAHGDWMMESLPEADTIEPFGLWRTHPMRSEGPHKGIELTVADLDESCDALVALAHCVVIYGTLCLLPVVRTRNQLRIRDLLLFEEGAVRDNGPRSAHVNFL